ncbi:O-antigen ligase family protein [Streptomyces poriticola]|uniref:O-antigen ligase family protein n=1 Tax=Streptomyces poriticola TaxID=3120506 RepID=UPI002FCE30D9
MVILGACATWALVTAAARGGRPEGVLLAVLAVAAGYAAGRICGALVPVAAAGAAALAGVSLTVAVPQLAVGPRFAVPLGHAGATAALLALSAGAACCAAWAARTQAVRFGLWLLAVGITATAAVLDSVAGCAGGALVLLGSLAAGRVRRRGAGIAVLGSAVGLTAAVVWAVAAARLPAGPAAPLEDRLTAHRVELWRDALDLLHADAALGVGPGRFGELSATAALASPPDGKPHSAPLQQAAEQGAVGVLLLAAAFGWVLVALWRSPRPTPVVLTAGVALASLAAIASVGNALSFTAVSVGAGLLAGLATARSSPAEETTAPTPGTRTRGDRPPGWR